MVRIRKPDSISVYNNFSVFWSESILIGYRIFVQILGNRASFVEHKTSWRECPLWHQQPVSSLSLEGLLPDAFQPFG